MIAVMLCVVLSAFVFVGCSEISAAREFIPTRVVIENSQDIDLNTLATQFEHFEFDEENISLIAYNFIDQSSLSDRFNANLVIGEQVKTLFELDFCETYNIIYIVMSIVDSNGIVLSADYK